MKSVSSLVTAALLCACLLSCGTSPTPRFYSLNALSQGEDAAPASDLGIGVGPLYIPRYLERPQIVTRSGESQLSYDQFNRWGGSLESEVLRVLGENLGILLGTDRIAVYPRRVAIRTDYRVRLDFERFEGEGDDILALRVRWVLMPESGEAIAVELTTVREPVEGSGVGALVAAHSRALAELSRQIAARIRALEASADAS